MFKYLFTYEKIKRYLKDLLSDEERYVVEREIEKNPFEKEAMEGLEQISPEEFAWDVKQLQSQIETYNNHKKSMLFLPQFQIAAGLLLLLTIGFLLFSKFSNIKNVSKPIVTIENQLEKDTIHTEVVSIERKKELPNANSSKSLYDRKAVDATLDEIRENKNGGVVFEEITHEDPQFSDDDKIIEKKLPITVTDVVESVQKVTNAESEAEARVIKNDISMDATVISNEKERVTKNYSGIVTAQTDGLPLPGVTVKIKGMQKGTVTDFDGQYNVAANIGDTIEFSAVGFESEKIIVSNTEKLTNILLQENLEVSDETVIIGYGKAKKQELTGAVTSVKTEKLKETRSVSFEEALKGKVQGVAITESKQKSDAKNDISTTKENFKKWVYSHLNSEVFKKNTLYEAEVSFAITKKGKLKDVVIKNNLPLAVKKEIERTLLASPKWNGALSQGKKVTQQIDLKLEMSF